MRVTRWIENNYVEPATRLLNQIHQDALGIRLRKFHFHPAFSSALPHLGFYLGQAEPTVHLRFTRPQQVQIRSVQEQYLHKRLLATVPLMLKAMSRVPHLKTVTVPRVDLSDAPNTTRIAYSVDSDLPTNHPNRKKAVQLDAGT